MTMQDITLKKEHDTKKKGEKRTNIMKNVHMQKKKFQVKN